MKTVLQSAKYVFWPLKWSKLAIVGAIRASPIHENPFLKSKEYFKKSLSTFWPGYATKPHQKAWKQDSNVQNVCFGP